MRLFFWIFRIKKPKVKLQLMDTIPSGETVSWGAFMAICPVEKSIFNQVHAFYRNMQHSISIV